MSDKSTISLITLSCDKYKILWPLFVKRFEKYWPDFAGNKYLLTNFEVGGEGKFEFIDIGEDIDWSQNLQIGLQRINSIYVFLMLEDTPINQHVDQARFERLLEFCVENDADYLNTKALPLPRGENLGLVSYIDCGAHYRASLCNAIWRRDYLLSLLEVGESPWAFEVNASVRSNSSDKFFGTRTPLVSFDHLLIRGKLTREILSIQDVREGGLANHFDVMSRTESFFSKMMVVRNRLFTRLVSPRWQQKIRAMW